MRIFISWSGDRSKSIAEALRDWIPQVIQAIEPWLSSKDLDAGTRWPNEITEQLLECKAGILCLVSDNLSSPWIHFEAGALSKTVDKASVIPYLSCVTFGDLNPPLSLFNACDATREGTLRMLNALNRAMARGQLSEKMLEVAFEKFWPDLELLIARIPGASETSPIRTDRELLEQLVSASRSSVDAIHDLRMDLAGRMSVGVPPASGWLVPSTTPLPLGPSGISEELLQPPAGENALLGLAGKKEKRKVSGKPRRHLGKQ